VTARRSAATAIAPDMPEDLERLVTLAQTLSTVSSLKGLRDALAGPLASLLPAGAICLVAASNGSWQVIFSATPARERLDGYAWTPLVVEGKTAALLGLGPAVDDRSPFAAAAASLLEIGIRNVLVIENLRQRSARDGLTGCFNRSHGMEVLEAEIRRASRSRLPLSILMLDIDHFKEINDRDGHVAGDAVLVAVGERLLRRLRRSDTPCRFGGDEFLVILPETPPAAATQLADTLRRSLEQLVVPSPRGPVTVTVSVGVAAAAGYGTAAAAIDRADLALYDAKNAGRNRVCAAAPLPRVAAGARFELSSP